MNRPVAEQMPRTPRLRSLSSLVSLRLFSGLVGLVLWEILGRMKISIIIPSATETFLALSVMFRTGEMQRSLAASLTSFFIGFGIALVSGILLGALMARFRFVEYFFDLFIMAGNASPTLAFLPILIILFGINDNVRVAVAFIFSFWVIVVNTFTGIRGADRNLLEMARSYGATPNQLFWRIMLPAGLGLIIAGMRLGAGRAVKGMVNGEMLVTIVGLGAMIMTYGSSFNAPKLFAVLLVICGLAIVLDQVIRMLHRKLAPWSLRR